MAATGDARRTLPVVRVTLDLVARGRWAGDHPQRAAVLRALPLLRGWWDAHPDAVVDACVAAAAVVGRRVPVERWAGLVAAAPAPADPVHVRGAMLVAAWRCGLVRYRDAALDAAAHLPAELAGPLLALPGDVDVATVLERHRADRWWWPGAATDPGVVARVGGFLPLGGPWVGLPRAVPGGPSGWLALADGRRWAVVADVHGSAVVALDAELTTEPGPAGDATVPARREPPVPAALPVPWSDTVTGVVPAPAGPADVVLVSRAHSYALDVVRTAPQGRAA
ncbi:hypothetical protein [Cellulomonas shaoxiangyii]|uniref:Uncharacterized protein n=1 Tax=Cellulomonas shaoxiangyii TaxID=2566013 RepID=A0A4P7SLE2_9CELL|nr:hypothetical protein [Cellulomonas shaoxiangyii]QCB94006.1 hypothetical protein E5225_10940 [Cellulomonas shaoxiangyii]TGY80405.1 hypothetical protein E5226_14935 [Cellulomonas shaoxiangyii]